MSLVVLTGAGVSVASGLGTFRGPGGLWEGRRAEDLASPEGFAREPALVLRWYDERRARARAAAPNAAHRALADLARAVPMTLVTQNVDGLHARAGQPDVIAMHGTHETARCAACGARWPAPAVIAVGVACPSCRDGPVRPDIVWFGETPMHMDRITAALRACALFAAIGTSGHVWPAAGFARLARAAGARTVLLDLTRTRNADDFDDAILGPAEETVPAWAATLAAEWKGAPEGAPTSRPEGDQQL